MKKKIRLTFKVKKKRSETLKKCFLTTTKQKKIVIFFDFFWLFRFFGIIFILGKSIFLSKSKKSLKWRKKIRFFSEFFFRDIFPPVNDFLTCILHFMQFQKISYFCLLPNPSLPYGRLKIVSLPYGRLFPFQTKVSHMRDFLESLSYERL